MRKAPMIDRFNIKERFIHWMVAICFLYAALSGLAMWSRHLFWIATVLGGGEMVRELHPWGGSIFALVLGLMFRNWASQMKLDSEDRIWLRKSHRYAMNDESGVPESGKFNAGQKMLFWMQATSALLLFLSGAILWFPEIMPRALRLGAVLVHPLAAIGSIGGIILHVYMSAFAVPGSLRAMTQGFVTRGWAKAHHGKWFRQITKVENDAR